MTERRRRKPPLGQTIGGILFGFEQQVLRSQPPPHELVHHARPDAPVPASGGGFLDIRLPAPSSAAPSSAAEEPRAEGDRPHDGRPEGDGIDVGVQGPGHGLVLKGTDRPGASAPPDPDGATTP